MARTRALALALTVAGVAAGLAACHGGLHCGDTVTTDVTLTADLTNCPGDGLVIGANGVTVNLNGHTIDGDGAEELDNFASGNAGIRADNRRNVAIYGGTIQELDNGVSLLGTSSSIVRDLVITDIANGVRVITGGSNRIVRTDVRSNDRNGSAIVLIASHGNRLEANINSSNEFGHGLALRSSHFNTAIGNRWTGSGNDNIDLVDSNGNLIDRNDASNSNGYGISVTNGVSNRITNNLTDSESSGLVVAGGGSNEVIGNDAGDELSVNGSDDNLIAFNTGRALQLGPGTSSGNEVIGNRIDGADFSSGISVDAGNVDATLTGNLVLGATADGIRVDQAGTVVTDNTANRNAGYGIRAVPGVVDGGGNTARDNLGPAQCLNVVCS